MNYYEYTGNFERGLTCGELILSRDNTREMVHLQMMRLHWCLGDRGAALAQYKRCAQILRDELGIAPMKETTHIYQQMVNNQYISESLATRNSDIVPMQAQNAIVNYQVFDNTLQKLKHLQSIIEEARLEIRNIERIIASNIKNFE
jgi:DNA-binding SARP family transcriptional activator